MRYRPIRTLVAAATLALSLLPTVGQARPETPNGGTNPGQSNGNSGGGNQTAERIDCADSAVVENEGYLGCIGSIKVNDKELGGWGNASIKFGAHGGIYDLVGATDAGDADLDNGPFGFFDGGHSGTLQLDEARIGPFLLALRAGDEYSLYQFGSKGGIASFDFDTLGIGRAGNGAQAHLTAAAIYGGSERPAAAAIQVPEPGTPALLLAGLVAAGLLARRRRA